MKRTVLMMILALICAASHAQVNPKMQQLFDKLTELDEAPKIVKSGGKDQPVSFDYRVHLYYGPNMYQGTDSLSLDSILREDRNRLAQQLSIIRNTLDELQADAAESYHYEYHKGGRDTIIYSMNLCLFTSTVSHIMMRARLEPPFNISSMLPTLGHKQKRTVLSRSPPTLPGFSYRTRSSHARPCGGTTRHIPTRYMPWTQKISNHAPSLEAMAWKASPMHRYSPCHVSRKRKPASSTMRYRGWLCDSQKATWMSCTATII